MKSEILYPGSADKWGPGPWSVEPDKLSWTDEATKYPCLIVRNGSGALCGYVGVSKNHPLYLLDYDEGQARELDAHGGLTYSNRCQGHICHETKGSHEDVVWWFGFDCAHYMDVVPAIRLPFDGSVYRDVEYVKEQCANLARQLMDLDPREGRT